MQRIAMVLCFVVAPFAIGRAGGEEVSSNSTDQMVARAINYLKIKGQRENGAYEEKGVGVTALVTTAVLTHGRTPQDPLVAKSLKYIESQIRPDGGIYAEGSTHRNYETCLALVCLSKANKDGRYDKQIANADKFLKGMQWVRTDEGPIEESQEAYGGAGYGSHKRPDLSNTAFFVEALKSAGNEADSEAIQAALVFVSRCQNMESEHNTTKFASKVNDGGFYYTIAAGGNSEAGPTENGGLRSYASMTYAGLKSMIYAGVEKDDPRVKAAVGWIKKHYNLNENVGMGAGNEAMRTAGLYYFYNTFAKALDAAGIDKVETTDGKLHDWRAELLAQLAKRQQQDGSWINTENNRWREGDANLVTGYALLALAHCK